MDTLRLGLVAASLAAASGCGTHYNYYNGTPYIGGALPAGNVPVYRILPNTGTTVSVGQVAGYGLTASTGGSYRVVWTGDAQTSRAYREFYGSIWTTGAFDPTRFSPGCNGFCPLEGGDAVSNPVPVAGGQRVDFDTFAADGLKGLDFVISAEPVYFDFYIDGLQYPDLVFFPGTDATPPGAISSVQGFPFALTTQ
jgi:hypothetical protein